MRAQRLQHATPSDSAGLAPYMVQRACACGGSAGLNGTCADCRQNKLLGKPLQAKLRINEPGDAYEQEADRVAAQVMHMADTRSISENVTGSPSVQRRVAADESASMLQRAGGGSETPVSEPAGPKDGGNNEEGSRCPSWRADPQSISKRAAETYVQNDITPPSQAKVEKIDCEAPLANGNYGCYVHFSDGLVVRVIVREKDIVVGMGPGPITTLTPPPATPLCFYDYHCPDGHLVLTVIECKSAKPAAPSGPTLVGQRRAVPGASGSMDATPIVNSVLARPGQPLDATTRGFFSARFGHDFANVRVHADAEAAESARSVNALAYTVGPDVVFGAGQYAPGTREGQQLLAHELTHVVQQGEDGGSLQRASDDDPVQETDEDSTGFAQSVKDALSDPQGAAEKLVTDQLNQLANEPSASPSLYSHAGCPATFCQPFDNYYVAQAKLKIAGPAILAGIAKNIGSAVVPVWAMYMNGGSSQQNLSADFGAEFSRAGKTTATTQYLVSALRRDIEQNQDTMIDVASSVEVDFTSRLSVAIDEINKSNGPAEMIFLDGIPGNLAGGVGKDQVANSIGRSKSAEIDSRKASIKATLARNEDNGLTVTPDIKFTVKDTVDLCPGFCGGVPEQVATIPLSRFEATGLTGDVPFIVEFDAPAGEQLPFTIAAKKSVNP